MEKKTLLEEEIKEFEEDLEIAFAKLETVIKKPIKNQEIYLEQLKLRKRFIAWTEKKFKLLKGKSPNFVNRREVFYCEMGYNVGSEQFNKRPVVILQNDRGNRSSETTICAPITTHQGCYIFEQDGKPLYRFNDFLGRPKVKKLDYYEIPIQVEEDSSVQLKGFINIAQIRTISKKRLSHNPVAKITEDNDMEIKKAFEKLIFS